jgi:RimJ/RimL family protein N-acetyltransferase
MRLEGELKQHRFLKGRWWNTVIYAILQDEWK